VGAALGCLIRVHGQCPLSINLELFLSVAVFTHIRFKLVQLCRESISGLENVENRSLETLA
jgi:hypothetical protein